MRIKSYYEGRMDEQDRIVALIKDDESLHSSFCLQKKPLTNCYTCELIALIKGEK